MRFYSYNQQNGPILFRVCVSLGSKLQTVKTGGQKIILNLGILIDFMKLPVPTQARFLEGVDFKDRDTSKYSYFLGLEFKFVARLLECFIPSQNMLTLLLKLVNWRFGLIFTVGM